METKHYFDTNVEGAITSVVNDEYTTAKFNQSPDNALFESIVEMLENHRNEKDYEWLSNVSLPELASIILTDMSAQANQLYRTRDFVEVKLSGAHPEDEKKCQAAKLCINNTLNRPGLYDFQKYMRARTINSLAGHVYIVCGWEQEIRTKVTGQQLVPYELDVDQFGNPITDPQTQKRAIRHYPEDIMEEEIIKDCFTYEVYDPRNVYTDNKYCYSIQDKDWVILREEDHYNNLKKNEKRLGYINLNQVKELLNSNSVETDTSKESYNSLGEYQKPKSTPVKYGDHLHRWGTFYAIVKERDEYGFATEIEPGYDDLGNPLETAELVDTIVSVFMVGNRSVLTRFKANPFRDGYGRPYKPIIRSWCYIHPTKDTGLSDGMYLRDLQIAANDAFNMGADRTKLATLPVLKGRQNVIEGNASIYFEPEHVMLLENPREDLEEFKINDNIDGTLNQVAMLTGKMQQVTSIYPTTMGQLPAQSSTTATAVAGAEMRTNLRSNYKSLTVEYTLLEPRNWMILQMTYQFAREKTARELIGDEYIQYFDSRAEYSYTPVTSQIEQEYSKQVKRQSYTQALSIIASFPNPKTPGLINYLLGKYLELDGDQFPDYKKYLLDESVPPPMEGGGMMAEQQGTLGQPGMGNLPNSNQNNMAQSPQEQYVRGMLNG